MARRRQTAGALFVCLALSLAVAVYLLLDRDQSFERAEPRPHPANEAEEIVAAKVLTAYPPECVTFLEWGPHMSREEVKVLPGAKLTSGVWVRVRYRVENGESPDEPLLHDLVYCVEGDSARWAGFNAHGDAWKDAARRGELPLLPPDRPRLRNLLKGKGK
jgi:hypothetical protein